MSQVKPRLGQGRAGLGHKMKTPAPTLIDKPIAQAMEKQPKAIMPKTPKIQDNMVPIPNYTIPIKSKHDSGSRMIERKVIQDVSREIPIYPYPV